jgi:hypothetical protein
MEQTLQLQHLTNNSDSAFPSFSTFTEPAMSQSELLLTRIDTLEAGIREIKNIGATIDKTLNSILDLIELKEANQPATTENFTLTPTPSTNDAAVSIIPTATKKLLKKAEQEGVVEKMHDAFSNNPILNANKNKLVHASLHKLFVLSLVFDGRFSSQDAKKALLEYGFNYAEQNGPTALLHDFAKRDWLTEVAPGDTTQNKKLSFYIVNQKILSVIAILLNPAIFIELYDDSRITTA